MKTGFMALQLWWALLLFPRCDCTGSYNPCVNVKFHPLFKVNAYWTSSKHSLHKVCKLSLYGSAKCHSIRLDLSLHIPRGANSPSRPSVWRNFHQIGKNVSLLGGCPFQHKLAIDGLALNWGHFNGSLTTSQTSVSEFNWSAKTLPTELSFVK